MNYTLFRLFHFQQNVHQQILKEKKITNKLLNN